MESKERSNKDLLLEIKEEITILTTQRDGYKEQFNEQKRLFDSSQEELKRLKALVKKSWFESARNAKIANTRVIKGSCVNLKTYDQWSKENKI
jgi:hypothetical protein